MHYAHSTLNPVCLLIFLFLPELFEMLQVCNFKTVAKQKKGKKKEE